MVHDSKPRWGTYLVVELAPVRLDDVRGGGAAVQVEVQQSFDGIMPFRLGLASRSKPGGVLLEEVVEAVPARCRLVEQMRVDQLPQHRIGDIQLEVRERSRRPYLDVGPRMQSEQPEHPLPPPTHLLVGQPEPGAHPSPPRGRPPPRPPPSGPGPP